MNFGYLSDNPLTSFFGAILENRPIDHGLLLVLVQANVPFPHLSPHGMEAQMSNVTTLKIVVQCLKKVLDPCPNKEFHIMLRAVRPSSFSDSLSISPSSPQSNGRQKFTFQNSNGFFTSKKVFWGVAAILGSDFVCLGLFVKRPEHLPTSRLQLRTQRHNRLTA